MSTVVTNIVVTGMIAATAAPAATMMMTGGPPVVGFGDDVPAFILRVARPRRPLVVEVETVDVTVSAEV